MTAPFVDAKLPEVWARVACALVRREYASYKGLERRPVAHIQAAQDSLPVDGFGGLKSALMALQAHVMVGMRVIEWSDHAIKCSRMGYGFRRCWFDGYKATRRDPRVTNRGVRASTRYDAPLPPVEKAIKG